MDFLSGDLDRVFTALYELGLIEPMLDKNWKELYRLSESLWPELSSAIRKINKISSIKELRVYIESLPQKTVEALVIEVAREMAAFQERRETLH
jgi:hypothetical protein